MPTVLAAAVALGGLWFARQRVAGGRERSLDGAAYLRHVAPALRRAGCAERACHGGAEARLHLAPRLGDAAEAVREFHDLAARARDGEGAASLLWRRAVAGEGHPARLDPARCEARVLRAWIEGRATAPCP